MTVFAISAEQNRLDYLRRIEHRHHTCLALAFSAPEIVQENALLYQTVLRRKGLMFEASSILRKASHSAYRIDLQAPVREWLGNRYLGGGEIYEQWLSARAQLAKTVLAGRSRGEEEAYRANVDALSQAKRDLETRLARSAPEMKLASTLQSLTHTDVTAEIAPGTALIEIARIGRTAAQIVSSWATGEGYVAFVVHPGSQPPVGTVDLGDAAYLTI